MHAESTWLTNLFITTSMLGEHYRDVVALVSRDLPTMATLYTHYCRLLRLAAASFHPGDDALLSNVRVMSDITSWGGTALAPKHHSQLLDLLLEVLRAGMPALAGQGASVTCVGSMVHLCRGLFIGHEQQLARLERAGRSERQRGIVEALSVLSSACTVLHLAALAGDCGFGLRHSLGHLVELLRVLFNDGGDA